MHIKEVRPDLAFEVENLQKSRRKIFHAQRMIPYPIQQPMEPVSREFQEYSECLDTSLLLVDKLQDVHNRNVEYEICVRGKDWKASAIEYVEAS